MKSFLAGDGDYLNYLSYLSYLIAGGGKIDTDDWVMKAGLTREKEEVDGLCRLFSNLNDVPTVRHATTTSTTTTSTTGITIYKRFTRPL